MNRDRQTYSRQPVQRLDRRQTVQANRTRTREDYGSDVQTVADEEEDVEYDDVWPPKLSSSARPYVDMTKLRGQRYVLHPEQVQRIPPRRSALPEVERRQGRTENEEAATPAPKRRHIHPLLWLGVGMLIMLVLWQGGSRVLTWWQIHQDDGTYGRPRTAQYDVVVGHNDSPAHPSHFIALNLHSHVEIIELPGGDTSKAKIYPGPQLYGEESDLAPVTLTFTPINGDTKPDMIVNVQGSHIVYLNKNGQFVLQQQGQ